jgi:gas vesicle protein
MADRENVDFVTAFAIGAVLGVGAALLLRPSRPTGLERIRKELKPYGRKAMQQASRARSGIARGAGSALESGEELVSSTRDVLKDFRHEVDDIVSGARKDLSRAVENHLKTARKAARRTVKKVRS